MSSPKSNAAGPLSGIRVLEIASIGPGPYCSMLLSDLGAEVLRIDRIETSSSPASSRSSFMHRGRRSVAIDLKKPGASELILKLTAEADILIEGMRPGVMERLGLGPGDVLKKSPHIVYGRMTGWGQSGPRATLPGHDINYIATTGVLAGIGQADGPPVPPLNLVGDFGGALFLAFGLVAAAFEASKSGKGQVVDAAMVDATANMMTMMFGMLMAGKWSEERGTNVLDGGAPFYGCYETADNEYVAIGAIEPKFFSELVRLLKLPQSFIDEQNDRAKWPAIRQAIADSVRKKTRDEWIHLAGDGEACLAPVLSMSEAIEDTHNRAREMFVDVCGVPQPAPAPRFSRTPGAVQGPPREAGADTTSALSDWGCDSELVRRLLDEGVLSDALTKTKKTPKT